MGVKNIIGGFLIFLGLVMIIGYFVLAFWVLEIYLRGVFAWGWPVLKGMLAPNLPSLYALEYIDPHIPIFGGLWKVNYFTSAVMPTAYGLLVFVGAGIVFIVVGYYILPKNK